MRPFAILFLSCLLLVLFFPVTGSSQSVSINTDGSAADSSAILDVKSDSKGILIPRTSTTSRLGIINPANGLMLYDTTTSTFWFYNGAGWNEINTGITGWSLGGNAGTDPANHFIGTTDNLPLRLRLNNIWAGELNSDLKNYFIGDSAGITNTTGILNVGIGSGALKNNTEGFVNTAIGAGALNLNTYGAYNSALGRGALDSNTTGTQNTAVGYRSLRSNIDGWYNTAMGVYALYSNKDANYNTANGAYSLYRNVNGVANTALGYGSLSFNSSGSYNIAVGSASLYYNTTGIENIAVGTASLQNNITGSYNSAVGHHSMYSNFNANYNTSQGYKSLYNHRRNDYNTAIGGYALHWDTSGTSNTAVGYGSLFDNRNGFQNTAVGQGALYFNKAINNTAVGYGALSAIVTGYNNIAIGSGSGTHPSSPAVFNTISIGNDGYLNAFQNQAFIGNLSTIWIGGQVNWSTFSDSRIKTAVSEDIKGLDFITRLRPVSYYKNFAAMTALTGNKEIEDSQGKFDGEQVKYSGFLAQEVEIAAKQSNYNFSGLHTPRGEFDLYSLSYAEFVVPLVKAVQEQQAIINSQQKIIDAQTNKMEQLEKRIAAIELKK